MNNPYDTLGVPRDADPTAITAAYRQLAKRFHPDRNPGDDDAKAQFAAVDAAYSILNDPSRRARFDATGETDAKPAQHPQADVLIVLGSCLSVALQEMLNQGHKPDNADLVKFMRRSLEHEKGEIKKKLKQMEVARAAYAQTVERFREPAGDEPLLATVARSHVANIDKAVTIAAADDAKITKALDYLAKCGYEFTARAGWGSMTTATGGTAFWGIA